MARRALDFALAHPLTDAGYSAIIARLKVEVAKVDTLGRLQVDGSQREHTAVSRRATLRSAVRSRQLKRLATLMQLNAAAHPELVGKYDLPPSSGPNRAFLLRAQLILASAVEQKEILAELGLGDTFIDDLTTAVNAFDLATQDSHVARADHVGALGEFSALARRGRDEVTLIGTYIETVFANDAQTIVAWRSARNLAGPFTKSKVVMVVEPPAPSGEGAAAQAA